MHPALIGFAFQSTDEKKNRR